MALLLRDSNRWKYVEDRFAFDFQLPGQIVDSNLGHPPFCPPDRPAKSSYQPHGVSLNSARLSTAQQSQFYFSCSCLSSEETCPSAASPAAAGVSSTAAVSADSDSGTASTSSVAASADNSAAVSSPGASPSAGGSATPSTSDAAATTSPLSKLEK